MSVTRIILESSQLILAAKSGNAAGVAAAITAGADMEAVDPEFHSYTALHWSAKKGYRNILINLLCAGVNVNAKDDRGQSALHKASLAGHESIASLLIGRGILIDAADKLGCTPLMYACQQGRGDLVELLIDAHANI